MEKTDRILFTYRKDHCFHTWTIHNQDQNNSKAKSIENFSIYFKPEITFSTMNPKLSMVKHGCKSSTPEDEAGDCKFQLAIGAMLKHCL
jgi:hypothetical protein